MSGTIFSRQALVRASLVAVLAAMSACGSDADIRSAEQATETARAQLEQDERSGDHAQIATDSERLSIAERALSAARLSWSGPRGKGW